MTSISEEGSFAITAIIKLAHAKLLEVVEQRGGIPVVARELGICEQTLRSWVYLRYMPLCAKTDVRGRRRSSKSTTAAVAKLCEWAESSPEQLFPGYVRERIGSLQTTARITRNVEPQMLSKISAKSLTYTPDYDAKMSQEEARQRIGKVLKTLSYREREIIKLRYGLGGDGFSYTLEEVGHIFKVTKERIRCIEAKAIRKMQQPSRISELLPCME